MGVYILESFGLLRGKINLPITFWVWAVGGTLIVRFLWSALFALALPNNVDATAQNGIVYGSMLVILIWSIFIAVAVFNSAGQFGARSIWGWTASLIAIAGISVPLYMTISLFFGVEKTWDDIETDIAQANIELPMPLGEGLLLTGIRSNSYDRSVTFLIDIDTPSITRRTFDRKVATNKVLAHCDVFADLLYYPTETARFVFNALDESNALVLQFPSHCGIEIYKLGPSSDFLPRAFYFQARW